MSSSWIRRERRLAIYIRDNFTYCYCGTDLKNVEPDGITLDHLIPRNVKVEWGGGGHENTNLVTACRSCNSSRQDKAWIDYATGGARDRIETQRNLSVNTKLAKALITAQNAELVQDVEDLR